MEKSPFHKALHYFSEYYKPANTPILHIDLHGKLDRKTDLNMDIGTTALNTFWHKGDSLQKEVKAELSAICGPIFNSMDKVYKDNMKFSYELEP